MNLAIDEFFYYVYDILTLNVPRINNNRRERYKSRHNMK